MPSDTCGTPCQPTTLIYGRMSRCGRQNENGEDRLSISLFFWWDFSCNIESLLFNVNFFIDIL
jgi:hypothetical protein